MILESTTYPGTTEELVGPILDEGSGLVPDEDFHLGYSPERIDPGNPTWSLENTPKVVSGINPASLEAVRSFYDRLVERTVPVSGTREAELTKLLENTFRHVNIALVNELAMFAAELGIDVWEAIDAAIHQTLRLPALHPRARRGRPLPPHRPELSLVEGAPEPGPALPLRGVGQRRQRAHAGLRGPTPPAGLQPLGRAVNGSRILLLGLAYKRNTGDAREAPGAVIAKRCRPWGPTCGWSTPMCPAGAVPYPLVELTAEELAAADGVIILTDHDAFDYDLVGAHGAYILDTRNRLDGPNVERL